MVPYSQAMTGIVPITFTIPGLDEFVDLGRSYFEIELKLNSPSTNGIVADTNAASNANNTKFLYVTNNLALGLFKQVNLCQGGVLMSEQTDTYMYKAFIETVLNYSRDEGSTLLAPAGWVNYMNVIEQLEASDANNDISTTAGWAHNNTNALKTTTKLFYGNNKATMIMNPHLAAMRTGRLLIPRVEMVVELVCNTPDFFLFGTKTSGMGVKKYVTLGREDIKVTFHLCRIDLNVSVYNELTAKIDVKRQWANYPTVRSQIRTFSFDGKTTLWTEDQLFTGRLPDRVVIGLLDSKAFNGDLEYYPYAFQDFGVTSVRQLVGGEEYPYPTLELNGTNTRKDWLGYQRLLETSGSMQHHCPHMIQPGDWGFGKNCTFNRRQNC
ncbi:uncharacterized protein F54H12.2-like [Montipora capricornis]|uniref:uncharacterized protein F54H12.2-like n=1 Tax=Montipora capricornis TaxID=246305 RepID=UPI0035F1D8EC